MTQPEREPAILPPVDAPAAPVAAPPPAPAAVPTVPEPAAAPEAMPRPTLRTALAAKVRSREVQDTLALLTVRILFLVVGAGVGLAGTRVLGAATMREDLDPLLGAIIGASSAGLLILVEATFSKSPIRTLSAVVFGLLAGAALSLVFQYVIEFIVSAVTTPGFYSSPQGAALLSFLKLISTTVFCYFGVVTLLSTKEDFRFIIPYVEFRRQIKRHSPLLLDTSCFIDGRLHAILATGVFDQRLVVPRFVLTELQRVADSADKSLRERGRRGLDILQAIEREHHLEVIDHELEPGQQVDDALLILASVLGGKIVSTDFNLQKNARLQGLRVINVNDLAAAVKPQFVPGESLTVKLLREGDDRGQAVGFLRDGTMVVVEGGRQKIGQDVAVEVTSSLQTNAGKMVFGRLKKPPRAGEA